jgi:hypothetical protein
MKREDFAYRVTYWAYVGIVAVLMSMALLD